MRAVRAVLTRTLVSFYDDQMAHHAAALTYYSLMSLFPATLLGLSLLGLLGQYPVLGSLIMVFVGGRFASDLFGFIGLGPTAASI